MSQIADSTKIIDEFKGLVAKSLQGNMQLFNRFSALAGDAAARFSSAATRSQSLPSVSESFAGLVQLNLAYWSALNDHALAFANELANATEKAFALQPRPNFKQRDAKLEITASPGERVVAAFQVENSLTRALHVAFQAADAVSATGVKLKINPVLFNPSQLTLPPKAQAVVQATIDVPNGCQPGETYTLLVQLIGFPMKTMTIRLHIVAGPSSETKAAANPAVSQKSFGKSKKTKRKGSR